MNALMRGDFEWFLSEKEGPLLGWKEKDKRTFGDQRDRLLELILSDYPITILHIAAHFGVRNEVSFLQWIESGGNMSYFWVLANTNQHGSSITVPLWQ